MLGRRFYGEVVNRCCCEIRASPRLDSYDAPFAVQERVAVFQSQLEANLDSWLQETLDQERHARCADVDRRSRSDLDDLDRNMDRITGDSAPV